MDYDEAIKYLYDLKIYGMSLGLERIEFLLRSLGSPHKGLPTIHVAGTNGKGSVCAMVSSILESAGFNVGLFTSPHLLNFEERIRINQVPISQDKLCMLVEKIKPISESMVKELKFEHPTFFESATAMAFYQFYDEEVDYTVLEVGLGGRLDATNVVDPLVCVITSVSLDHTHVLGKTFAEVAYEKAGIIKEGVPLVCGVVQDEIHNMIKDISITKKCEFYSTKEIGGFSLKESTAGYQRFDLDSLDSNYSDLKMNLAGEHQLKNAQIAVLTVDVLKRLGVNIPEKSVREGLEKTKWPARFEIISENPTVILDCAHNPSGMRTLSKTLNELYGPAKKTLVMGIMRDKDISGIVKEAITFSDNIIITKPTFERAAEPEIIMAEVKKHTQNVIIIENVAEAVNYAISKSNINDVVCVSGSIFNVAEAMKLLLDK